MELFPELYTFYYNTTIKTFVLEQYISLGSSFDYLKTQEEFSCVQFAEYKLYFIDSSELFCFADLRIYDHFLKFETSRT